MQHELQVFQKIFNDHKNAYFGEVDEFVTLAADHIVEY